MIQPAPEAVPDSKFKGGREVGGANLFPWVGKSGETNVFPRGISFPAASFTINIKLNISKVKSIKIIV